MKQPFLSLALALILAASLAAAQDFSQYQVKTTPLSDHLYLLTGAGGNMAACVGPDGVLLVDADYVEMSDKVQAALAGITDQPVRFLFNTHWHFDHVGGNAHFAGIGSIIVAHENVRRYMAADQFIDVLDREVVASPPEALPVITFTDSLVFHLNAEEIVIFHPPGGHTDGDGVVVFRKANVIHVGDIFFNCGYPFIDVSHGGSIDGMIAAIRTILQVADGDTRIIPGHGPLADKEDFEAYLGILSEFRAAVAEQMAAGKDLAEVKAANATAALDEQWGAKIFPPDLFTEMVFLSLQAQ